MQKVRWTFCTRAKKAEREDTATERIWFCLHRLDPFLVLEWIWKWFVNFIEEVGYGQVLQSNEE